MTGKQENKSNVIQSVWLVKVASSAKTMAKKGAKVKKEDVLAVLKKKKIKTILFPSWLKAGRGIWKKGCKKKSGEKLAAGEIIYEKKGLFRQRWRWESSVNGRILLIDEEKGILKVVLAEKEKRLLSPVDGKVTAVSPSRIKLTFSAQRFIGKGVGKKRSWGILETLNQKQSLAAVDWQSRGKVLVLKEINFPLLEKSLALGVKGLIGFSFPEIDLVNQSIDLPVLLFEEQRGMMQRRMNKELKKLAGSRCFLDALNNQLLVCIK